MVTGQSEQIDTNDITSVGLTSDKNGVCLKMAASEMDAFVVKISGKSQ